MTNRAQRPENSSIEHAPADRQKALGARTGHIVCIDSEGRFFVDFPGNPHGPLAAKLTLNEMEIADAVDSTEAYEVLLVFDSNDLRRPVIIGRIRDHAPTNGVEICVRGRRFTVDTQEDIELRCGEARMRITRDGKLTILGDDVVSRARGRNRIKGGTVRIN